MKSKTVDLFCNLVSIPSPSGKELNIGKYIKSYLNKINIASQFDKTGKVNLSNSGNLIAKLKGNKGQPILLFVAHMDTVETGKEIIIPKINKGTITSKGKTILGADNKASVACLLEALGEISTWDRHPTIIAAFTTREEQGEMGASLLKFEEKIDYVFNLDGSDNPGDFVYQTLGEVPFEIKLTGKAAHAAVEPERGINAIKAAALLITKLNIGKDEKGNVLNIGKISGGRANNIVPDEVVLQGQARAYTKKDLDNNLINIEKTIKDVCNKTGCSYTFNKLPEEGAPPASISKNHAIIHIAEHATKRLDLPFSLHKGSYTSDANFLNITYPTLTVCRGGKMPHSQYESITIDELVKLKRLILELIKQSILIGKDK